MQILDLSVVLDPDVRADPPMSHPAITYFDHQQTFDRIGASFPNLRPEDLPDGQAWAIEKVSLTTHNGTHLDAPWHFHPTTNHALVEGGEPAPTIDEIPLDWCMRPGVKLDFRHLPDGHVVSAAEVEVELDRIGHKIQPYDIVLINTRAGERYGHADYVDAGCGMSREATLWLLERGVKITGTDGWSWDAPFSHTARQVAATNDTSLIWQGHKAGRERAYCHIEKLARLDELPPDGFTVVCFPVKIKRASAGWCRTVALIG